MKDWTLQKIHFQLQKSSAEQKENIEDICNKYNLNFRYKDRQYILKNDLIETELKNIDKKIKVSEHPDKINSPIMLFEQLDGTVSDLIKKTFSTNFEKFQDNRIIIIKKMMKNINELHNKKVISFDVKFDNMLYKEDTYAHIKFEHNDYYESYDQILHPVNYLTNRKVMGDNVKIHFYSK